MFEACLTLPRNPGEARLIADSLDALARALRDWPPDAWRKVDPSPTGAGLFERLVARTAPVALDPKHKTRALHSAEAVASVLRVLWPETRQLRREEELALATS